MEIDLSDAGRASMRGPAPALQTTTIYVIRHAEKNLDGSADPHLSRDGAARAGRIATMLQDEPIAAVFVTRTIRSRETAAPICEAKALTPIEYDSHNAHALAQAIESRHHAESVLVVAHANTLPWIVHALGGPDQAELDPSEYGLIYTLIKCGDAPVRTIRRRYEIASAPAAATE